MIVKQQQNEAEYIGDIQENKVGIDARNIDFIATLLTSNLYSKPFASFLRETVSNAYDSHIEAGTEQPILLLIESCNSYDTNHIKVSIRDFGVGISPERFEQIYRNIGSSTKRDSNDFIGCFGIGRFSCLACADVANVTSYYNGVKYSYLMYKNNGGINIDKLSQESGDFKNGLEVSVETHVDRRDFQEAIEGLYLFDKLYIENKCSDWKFKEITNAFNTKIVENCGDLPFNTRGVIVNLDIGSVDVTPNREALQLSNRTKDVLNKKVTKIKDYWSTCISKKISNIQLLPFYTYVTTSTFELGKLKVSKDDIQLDNDIVKIDGCNVPDNYAEFLIKLKYASIPRAVTYKIFDSSRRRYISFDDILSQRYKTVLKEDKVTKNITIEYFRNALGKSIVFGCDNIPQLVEQLKYELRNAMYRVDETQLKESLLFTFTHTPLYRMSNDKVPQDYIEAVKQSNVKKQTVDKHELIRVFYEYGYRQEYLDNYLKLSVRNAPFVIYAANSRDENELYAKIAELLRNYYNESSCKYPHVITLKNQFIPSIKDREKFVSITDFLYLRNNFWSKMLTADIIDDKFEKLTDNKGPGFKITMVNTPLWREFQHKYYKQLRCLYSLHKLPIYNDIMLLYKTKGWLNDYDISYFKFEDEDVEIINNRTQLGSVKEQVCDALVYSKYGKRPKLGVCAPSSNFIYKYTKRK